MSTYEENSYKSLLQSSLLARKERHGSVFTFQKMAEACRVQKTYLSRVLNDRGGKAHLSADQLFLACDFLGFGEDERAFALLLLELERTSVPERRRGLSRELEALRRKHRKSERALEKSEVIAGGEDEDLKEYYLDPFMQLVHIFLTVPAYAADPESVRTELGLPKARFAAVLKSLGKLGIISLREGRYAVTRRAMHLSTDSPLLSSYRMNLRLRALDRLQRLPSDKSYAFSVVFSADEKARAGIHERFLAFLKEVESQVRATTPRKVYQMNFDLLPWTD